MALRVFMTEQYDGLQWWSYHRPEWTVGVVWSPINDPTRAFSPLVVRSIEPLTLDHAAVRLAADVLQRKIRDSPLEAI